MGVGFFVCYIINYLLARFTALRNYNMILSNICYFSLNVAYVALLIKFFDTALFFFFSGIGIIFQFVAIFLDVIEEDEYAENLAIILGINMLAAVITMGFIFTAIFK